MVPPFYPNTEDNTHCFQAVIKMICGSYLPDQNHSWERIDKVTNKEKGKWTWPMSGYIWLAQQGLGVTSMSLFDFRAFCERGYDYFLEEFGKEIADQQQANTNMSLGQQLALAYLENKNITNIQSLPSVQDLKTRIDRDSLIVCNVNQHALNNHSGYSGHFVLLYAYDDKGFVLHDPGLPSKEARFVQYQSFEKAWAYPDVHAQNFVAVRVK